MQIPETIKMEPAKFFVFSFASIKFSKFEIKNGTSTLKLFFLNLKKYINKKTIRNEEVPDI